MICKSVSYYSVQLCIVANADWVNDLLVSPSTSDKENQGTSMAYIEATSCAVRVQQNF